jgi:hypothetical protein
MTVQHYRLNIIRENEYFCYRLVSFNDFNKVKFFKYWIVDIQKKEFIFYCEILKFSSLDQVHNLQLHNNEWNALDDGLVSYDNVYQGSGYRKDGGRGFFRNVSTGQVIRCHNPEDHNLNPTSLKT